MKKIISLILVLSMVFSLSLTLISCNKDEHNSPEDNEIITPDEKPNDDEKEPEVKPNPDPTPEPPKEPEPYRPSKDVLVKPEFKDYGRGTVDLDKYEYVRPEINLLLTTLNEITDSIKNNNYTLEQLQEKYKLCKKLYDDYGSDLAFVMFKLSIDKSNAKWVEEDAFLNENSALVENALNNLYIAAANSPNNKQFIGIILTEEILNKYLGKEEIPENVLKLVNLENDWISKYNSISTDTITVTYNMKTATVSQHLEDIKNAYAPESEQYKKALADILDLYNIEVDSTTKNILVELLKVRSKIATEQGEENYLPIAYKKMDLLYTPADTFSLFENVVKYIYPVFISIYSSKDYIRTMKTSAPKFTIIEMMNILYEIFEDLDPVLFNNYCYMLQHKLYDVEYKNPNRAEGSYMNYILNNNSPYIFTTLNGNFTDMFVLAHEFGHFSCGIETNNAIFTNDIAEIPSQALELITLENMGKYVTKAEFKMMKMYYIIDSALNVVYQSQLAYFEHNAYRLPYDQISLESLENIAKESAKEFKLPFDDVTSLISSHLFLSPCYIQSYVTSMLVSFEIYFDYLNNNKSMESYNKMINNCKESVSFEELLATCGLVSPFKEQSIKEVANNIYREFKGIPYFPY